MTLWFLGVYFGAAAVLYVVILIADHGLPRKGERDILWAPLFWPPILFHIVWHGLFDDGEGIRYDATGARPPPVPREPQTVEIPQFNLDESFAIEKLFEANGIAFSREVILPGGSGDIYTGPPSEYRFRVPVGQFHLAIALLKEHFGLQPDTDPTPRICPACGAPMRGEPRCPACDLNVTGAMPSVHPFAFFLKRHGLL